MSFKTQPRTWYYKVLPMAARQIGWSDDAYRDLLKRHGAILHNDKYSASSMGSTQLQDAYDELKKAGFKIQPKQGTASATKDWRKPRIEKIQAIWMALHDAGVVRDRSEKAMLTWCASISGKPKLQWYTSTDLNNVIEGLKKWATREQVKLK